MSKWNVNNVLWMKTELKDSCSLNTAFSQPCSEQPVWLPFSHELWAPNVVFAPPASPPGPPHLSTSRQLNLGGCPSVTNKIMGYSTTSQLTRQPGEPESIENEPAKLAKEWRPDAIEFSSALYHCWYGVWMAIKLIMIRLQPLKMLPTAVSASFAIQRCGGKIYFLLYPGSQQMEWGKRRCRKEKKYFNTTSFGLRGTAPQRNWWKEPPQPQERPATYSWEHLSGTKKSWKQTQRWYHK